LSPVNTDELEDALMRAEHRVLEIQAKLHRWAREDPHRRFDDLFKLVADPAFLLIGWVRVRGNKVGTTRYRYRGSVIPSPWPATG
jgi:RNA-directed DNA polymerase